MPSKYISPLMAEKFGYDPVGWSGDNAIYLCSECENRGFTPDQKGHLWAKEISDNQGDTIIYNCWRCGYKGLYRSGQSLGYKIDKNRDLSEIVDLARSSVYRRTSYTSEFPYQIPFTSAIMVDSARQYLNSRGFDNDDILHYDIRYAGISSGKLYNRIIIPNKVISKNDNNNYTDMYVARSLDKDNPLRYLNPSGQNKSKVVFNLHRIPEGSPIIISEGALSSMSVGRYSVATYGKKPSDDQIRLILNNNPSAIYVGLDPDAIDNAIDLCDEFMRRTNVPIHIIHYPGDSDPNDVLLDRGREGLFDIIRNAELYNPLVQRIRKLGL